jgi:hypothetical protein
MEEKQFVELCAKNFGKLENAYNRGIGMFLPSEKELSESIEDATRNALTDLFKKYPENFYYCSLITSGEGHPPTLTAWSIEALERESLKNKSFENARWWLKWSYGESPYFSYGEDYFDQVRKLFSARPQISPKMSANEWDNELQLRLRAMEMAMKRLDSEGLFGSDEKRLGIVINVEVMPPDYGNTERALRLNPIAALSEWLEEFAEHDNGK